MVRKYLSSLSRRISNYPNETRPSCTSSKTLSHGKKRRSIHNTGTLIAWTLFLVMNEQLSFSIRKHAGLRANRSLSLSSKRSTGKQLEHIYGHSHSYKLDCKVKQAGTFPDSSKHQLSAKWQLRGLEAGDQLFPTSSVMFSVSYWKHFTLTALPLLTRPQQQWTRQ